jgi:hypothetical protein
MPYKFNVFTGTLDLVSQPKEGQEVGGPVSSTDKAIVRWNGTGGDLLQDSKTYVQDSGAIEAQAFITRRKITDQVVIGSDKAMITDGISIETDGELVIEADGELVIV